jgi:leucyl-tRNA synthetase
MELVNELYAFCARSECGLLSRSGEEVESIGTVERQATIAVLKEAVDALVRMISPFTPHMAEELWERLGYSHGVVPAGWPAFDEAVARADEIVVPVQINGKVRSRVTVPAAAAEDRLREVALADPQVVKHLEGKTVKKVVVVNGRMVSVVAN